MDAIASLELIHLGADGKRRQLRVRIGRPRYDERRSWACPILITGLDEEIREIHGEDSMQALCLAVQRVHTVLRFVLERGNRLLIAGDDATQRDCEDVDFPVDAYFGIGEPPAGGNAE